MARTLLCMAMTLHSVGLSVVLAAEDIPTASIAPPVDAEGRFWVYGEIQDLNGLWMPRPQVAVPSGWMPAEVTELLDENQTVFTCEEQPHSGTVCWRTVLERWASPYWFGIAWFTKDGWDPDATWPAYDLSHATKLCFWARGAEGDEVIQIKIGILCDKGRFGDQTWFPISTNWLRLAPEWKLYEIPLTKAAAQATEQKPPIITPADYGPRLKQIVNPFTIICSRDAQVDRRDSMTFYIDDIYYEIAPEAAP